MQTPVKFQNTGAFTKLSKPQKQEHPALEKFWTRGVWFCFQLQFIFL